MACNLDGDQIYILYTPWLAIIGKTGIKILGRHSLWYDLVINRINTVREIGHFLRTHSFVNMDSKTAQANFARPRKKANSMIEDSQDMEDKMVKFKIGGHEESNASRSNNTAKKNTKLTRNR